MSSWDGSLLERYGLLLRAVPGRAIADCLRDVWSDAAAVAGREGRGEAVALTEEEDSAGHSNRPPLPGGDEAPCSLIAMARAVTCELGASATIRGDSKRS